MTAPQKVSDAAILGCVRDFAQTVDVGPTQREIADHLGISHATVRVRIARLVDSGELKESLVRGYTVAKES